MHEATLRGTATRQRVLSPRAPRAARRAGIAPGRTPQDGLRDAYREHASAVYAYFAYFVGADVAEDLTAATFERVVRSWRRFDPRLGSLRTWVLAIARNLLTDHFRRERHAGPSLDSDVALLDRLAASENGIEELLSTLTVRAWLSHLKPREHQVLALRFGAALPASEIASLLDIREANVHQISSRAMARLREMSDEAGVSRSA